MMKRAIAWAGLVAMYTLLSYAVVHFYEREVIIRQLEQRIHDME